MAGWAQAEVLLSARLSAISHAAAARQYGMETLELLNAIQAEFDGQLGAVLHALPDAIAMVDPDGVIVFANHHLQELSAYRADELIGRPIEDLVPDHVAGGHERHRARFFDEPDRRPMGIGLEISLRQKGGSSIPVDVQLSAIEIGTGLYVIASVRDITHRKELDEALRRSEERFRSFVEAAPVMMFSLLPDGMIRSVNREFEKQTGWRRDDLIGTHFAPLVHPDDLSDALATLGQFVRNEEIDDHEVRIRATNGDYLLTESTLVPLSSDDQGVEMVGVIHDITERKRAEEELSAAKERFRQAFKQAPFGVALIDQRRSHLQRERRTLRLPRVRQGRAPRGAVLVADPPRRRGGGPRAGAAARRRDRSQLPASTALRDQAGGRGLWHRRRHDHRG